MFFLLIISPLTPVPAKSGSAIWTKAGCAKPSTEPPKPGLTKIAAFNLPLAQAL
jgi:hypothetical protein